MSGVSFFRGLGLEIIMEMLLKVVIIVSVPFLVQFARELVKWLRVRGIEKHNEEVVVEKLGKRLVRKMKGCCWCAGRRKRHSGRIVKNNNFLI